MDCCVAAGKPVVYEYEPKGKVERVSDELNLEAYVAAGASPPPAGIIALPDIFGYTLYPQTKQVADRLSAALGGAPVAVLDSFRGSGWPMDRFPPAARDDLLGWIEQEGGWEKMSKDVAAAAAWLRAKGAKKLAVIGFCWGVSIALQAAAAAPPGAEESSAPGAEESEFAAAGGFHPSLFGRDAEFAAALAAPVALFSARGDPLESVRDALASRPDARGKALAEQSVFVRMDDMAHGFCAARGDFKDPAVAQRAGEAVDTMAAFLQANLL